MPRSAPQLISRRRWREADARAVLQRLATSGLSLTEFAEREGISRQRLHVWRRRLTPSGSGPEFREVTANVRLPSTFEIQIAEVTVRLSADFDAQALRRLLAVLGERPSC